MTVRETPHQIIATRTEGRDTPKEMVRREMIQISNTKHILKITENMEHILRETRNPNLDPANAVMRIVLYGEVITTEGRNHQRESRPGKPPDPPAQGEGEERILTLIVVLTKGGIVHHNLKKVEDIITSDIARELHHHYQRNIAHVLLLERNQASLMHLGL
jgi:hypothetical protein